MKLKIENIFLYCLGTYFIASLVDLKKDTSNFLTAKRQINTESELEEEFILSDYEYFDNYTFSYILKDSEYYFYSNDFLICKISVEAPYKLTINMRRFNKILNLEHEFISEIETRFVLNYSLEFQERIFLRKSKININFILVKEDDYDIKLIIENNKDLQFLLGRFNNMENFKEYLNYKNFIIEFNEK